MPAEDHKAMKKVQCWIPQDTWDKLVSLGYNSPTIAVTKAFERLLEDPREDPRINPLVSLKDPLESPNIPVLNAKIEAIQTVLEEKDKSIERLENALKKADLREEDLKSMHNNYMLQVQSLINARSLSAPSGSRTTKEANRKKQEETGSNQEENRKFQEDSPAIKESPDVEHEVKPEASQEDKNHWKEKEATIEKTCKNCLQPFFAKNPKNEYCSPKCRTAYNRKK